jgi:glycosyltransferase involved in cell wall biosynthesis
MARICLQQATLIVCQTEWQQERLQDVAGTRNVVIRNPVDTDRFHPGQQGFSGRRGVLWIGRYDHTHKRPLLALEIARRCPHLDFTLVINRRSGDDDVRREVMADRLQNVCIQDYVPHSAMPELLRTCKVFMSTGSREYEGFPNVFLEAAASGTPVCALEDFGGFLARWQCGACSQGDLESLARQVRTLHDDAELWNRCSRSGRRAVLSQHSLPEVARQFTDVLRTVVHQPLAPQPLNDNQLPR